MSFFSFFLELVSNAEWFLLKSNNAIILSCFFLLFIDKLFVSMKERWSEIVPSFARENGQITIRFIDCFPFESVRFLVSSTERVPYSTWIFRNEWTSVNNSFFQFFFSGFTVQLRDKIGQKHKLGIYFGGVCYCVVRLFDKRDPFIQMERNWWMCARLEWLRCLCAVLWIVFYCILCTFTHICIRNELNQ